MAEALAARRQQLRDLFSEMITAYGAKNFDHFAKFLRDDTIFEWPYLPLRDFPNKMVGADAFIATSKAGMAECDPYRHKVDRFYDQLDPDMLIVEYHSDTVHHGTGQRYANTYLGILRFEADKVTYWKEYVNPLPILDVYGHEFRNKAVSSMASEA
jgi:ketosteroid isomerase-like protein